ncbi:hypothetical protein EDD36DRAFT_146882 [Exophiala viscosa]|uniref:Uncharacterized protein n=1 Tax=Exophiala viscosa TaxID=2486360 RepID=A0AAN6E2X9_9EURO|nr:hypothetical protein EDD36DRAFT_146882 [Exophiala viscosa]
MSAIVVQHLQSFQASHANVMCKEDALTWPHVADQQSLLCLVPAGGRGSSKGSIDIRLYLCTKQTAVGKKTRCLELLTRSTSTLGAKSVIFTEGSARLDSHGQESYKYPTKSLASMPTPLKTMVASQHTFSIRTCSRTVDRRPLDRPSEPRSRSLLQVLFSTHTLRSWRHISITDFTLFPGALCSDLTSPDVSALLALWAPGPQDADAALSP